MAGWWERRAAHLSLDPSQRRVLAILLGLLILYGGVRFALQPVYIDDPQPPAGDRSAELADRLDPNTADAAELSALPGIGDKRAKAIVAWREKVRLRDGKANPYESADDLYKVAGFARATVEQLTPYLVFPTTQKLADEIRTLP